MDELSVPLFNSMSPEAFNLKKLAYSRVELYYNNQVALIGLQAKDFVNLNAKFSETKGLTDIGMQIGSVNIVVLISEPPTEPGVFYLSIRSKGDYNSQRIAEEFGGGGHLKASGCKIIGDYEEVKKKTLEAVKKELIG